MAFTSDNNLELIKDYDFIIDGTDNFPAKFLINDVHPEITELIDYEQTECEGI